MNFGKAIELLNNGSVVQRAGWNGKGMWLSLVTNWNGNIAGQVSEDFHFKPWICMYTADNGLVPWLASQSDILADDWLIVDYAQEVEVA